MIDFGNFTQLMHYITWLYMFIVNNHTMPGIDLLLGS